MLYNGLYHGQNATSLIDLRCIVQLGTIAASALDTTYALHIVLKA